MYRTQHDKIIKNKMSPCYLIIIIVILGGIHIIAIFIN